MKNLFLLFLFVFAQHVYAVQIQGCIVEAESEQPLDGVTVVLTQMDSELVSHTATQENGCFVIQAPEGRNYVLTVSCIGYASSTIVIENTKERVDLGRIELLRSVYDIDEVTVSAKDYTKIDRQIMFPSAQLIANSFNGFEILSRMSLPGIIVNSVTSTISSMDNRNVQLRVNDVAVTVSDVLAINPQRVWKIEYIDLPGLRYGDNVGAVINIVLKAVDNGFSAGGSTRTALSTRYTDNTLYLKYNNKLSEFGLTYQYQHSDYKDYFKEEEQVLLFPTNTLQLVKKGDRAPNKNLRHDIALSYNWNNKENTILNFMLRNTIDRPVVSTNQFIDDEIAGVAYHSYMKTKDKMFIPSLDMYFQHSFGEKQSIIANALTTYISSDYAKTYYEAFENNDVKSDFSYNTDGTKYSLLSEIVYENKLNKHLVFSSGIQYAQAYIQNTYMEQSREIVNTMRTSDLHGYAQLQGGYTKFSYQLGIGYSRQSFNETVGEYAYYLLRPTVSLSYSPQEYMTLRYNFNLRPAIPTLSDLSDFEQRQNEYEVFMGNPNLKPYHTYANLLSLNYRKGRISLSPVFYYQYNRKPIMATISRREEDGKYTFVYSNENQKSYQHLQGRLYVTFEAIKQKLNITAFGVMNRFFNFGNTYTHCHTSSFGGIQLEGNHKNWSVSSSVTLGSEMLVGQTLFIYSPTSNAGIRYRYKKVQYGIEMINLFRPEGNPPKQEVISDYVQKKSATYVRDQGNLLRFTFAWNLDFGRKYNTKQKRINKFDSDAGIIK